MNLRIAVLLAALLADSSALAGVCHNVTDAISIVNYDLTTTLTKEQNQLGQAVELNKSQDVGIEAICPDEDLTNTDSRTYRSYRTVFPVVLTEGQWKYLILDPDYIMGAMSITDSDIGVFYPPGDYIHMGRNIAVERGRQFNIYDSNLIFRLKIIKPFIGTIAIPLRTMFDVYVTTNNQDPLSTIVYQITYSGTVTVPQNCTINGGQTIMVDLGKFNSGAFTTAGQKPYNVREKTFNVPIECNADVLSPAHLTLRMQATASSAIPDAISTTNSDVGIIITDPAGTILKPNDISSSTDFMTDTSGKADVTLKAYPISTTGKQPQEGIFTALACLRVDFA